MKSRASFGAIFIALVVGCGDVGGDAGFGGSLRSGANGADDAPEAKSVIEGDIIVSHRAGFAVNREASPPWPKGIIPFVVADDVPNPDRVVQAMTHWQDRTPIRFVKRTDETAYVEIIKRDAHCQSQVGYTGKKQNIALSGDCTVGDVIHELGHTVGLWHEHNRSDRDAHVKVLLENVAKGGEGEFEKLGWESAGAYDVNSIMHYGSKAFSVDGTKPTLLTLDGKEIIANLAGLSYGDVAGVKEQYKESAGTKSVVVSWDTWTKKTATAEYSLDLMLAGDKAIAPCVAVDTIHQSLSYTFDGRCVAKGTTIPFADVRGFRICSAENGDWSKAICASAAYSGEATVAIKDP